MENTSSCAKPQVILPAYDSQTDLDSLIHRVHGMDVLEALAKALEWILFIFVRLLIRSLSHLGTTKSTSEILQEQLMCH